MSKVSFKGQPISALGVIAVLTPVLLCITPGSVFAHTETAPKQESIEQVRSLLTQARDFIDQKQLDAARSLLESAAKLDPNPNSASVHQNLGYLYQEKGSNEQALKQYELALEFKPGMSQATFNVAQCYLAMERNADAIAWYQRFLKEAPDSPYAGKVKEMIASLQDAQQGEEANGDQARDYLATVTREGAYRWTPDHLPLRVYIADGKAVPGYNRNYSQFIVDSLDTWARASGSRISWIKVDNPESADIVCDWVSQFPKKGEGVEAGNTDLYARPLADGSLSIRKAHVSILTLNNGQSYSNAEIQRTCLHELGHALGLKEHSPYSGDVMFFSDCASQTLALSPRDRTTISRLYESYPVVSSRPEPARSRT